jgi:hypothetical protein
MIPQYFELQMLDRRDIFRLHIVAYLILFEKGVGGGKVVEC